MKHYLSIVFMVLCFSFSYAQTPTSCNPNKCYSGDVLNNPITSTNWTTRSGTPTYNATDGVWIWSYGDRGESVSTNFNFQRGKTYCITLDYRLSAVRPNSVPADATFNVLAVNNLTSGNYPAYTTNQAILSDSYNNKIPQINSGSFNTYQAQFTASTAFTDILLIPMNSSPGPGANQVNFEVKNFKIKEIIDCPCEIKADIKVKQKDICAYDFYVYVNSGLSTSIKGYLWDFGDGTTSTNKNATHYYTAPGTYIVTLSVYGTNKNGDCCVEQLKTKVTVKKECPQDCQLTARFKIGKPMLASYLNLINTSSSNRFTTIIGYEWYVAGTLVSTQKDLQNYKGKGKKVCLKIYGITKKGDCCYDEYCTDLREIKPNRKAKKIKSYKVKN